MPALPGGSTIRPALVPAPHQGEPGALLLPSALHTHDSRGQTWLLIIIRTLEPTVSRALSPSPAGNHWCTSLLLGAWVRFAFLAVAPWGWPEKPGATLALGGGSLGYPKRGQEMSLHKGPHFILAKGLAQGRGTMACSSHPEDGVWGAGWGIKRPEGNIPGCWQLFTLAVDVKVLIFLLKTFCIFLFLEIVCAVRCYLNRYSQARAGAGQPVLSLLCSQASGHLTPCGLQGCGPLGTDACTNMTETVLSQLYPWHPSLCPAHYRC